MRILVVLFLCLPTMVPAQGLKNDTSEPYPYQNPVIRHMYTADAAPHVMPDGRVWMVISVDSMNGGGYSTMHSYHLFSSADMKDWHDHGQVLHVDQIVPQDNDPEEQKWAVWAPDMVYRNGKYYLYIPVRILFPKKQRPNGGRFVETYLAVAECDTLGDRFEIVNPKIEGTKGIDPSVFIDDDGTPYLYWGSHMAAKLEPSMTELASEPKRLDVGTNKFMEAIWMHKRGGEYQVSYHTKYNWQKGLDLQSLDDAERKKSELAYSVGASPMGPFSYVGTLNFEPGVNVKNGPRHPEGDFVPWRLTLSNHGGILEYHGKEYLFYHTSALSSWFQHRFKDKGTWTQRSVCIDALNYDKDGKIIPVQQTLESVSAVTIDQPYEIKLQLNQVADKQGLTLKRGKVTRNASEAWLQFRDIDLGTGYYFFEAKAIKLTAALKIEIRADQSDGPLLGTAQLQHPADPQKGGVMDAHLREAKGKRDIYLVLKSETEKNSFTLKDIRFFAGSPRELD